MSDEINKADDGEELVVKKQDKAAKEKVKSDKKKPEKQKKPSKENIFKRMWAAIVRFCKNFKGEIKKIVWPKRQMVIKSTGIVLATIIIIGAGVWIVDFALSGGLKLISGAADKYHESTTAVSTTVASGDEKTTAKTDSSSDKTTTTTAKAETTTASTTESTTAD